MNQSKTNRAVSTKYSVTNALRKIDTSSILFFPGILLAVSAPEAIGELEQIAALITRHISNFYTTVTILGVLSAIIIGSADGVAVMGFEKIEFFWYLWNISLLALAGFFAGLGAFILQQWLLH